jgi:peptide/nickel transport system permease protein
MSLAEWLLTDTPGSRLQARLGRAFLGARALLSNGLTLTGLAVVLALVLTAAFASTLAPQDPLAQQLTNRLLPPSDAHLLGTDQLGRDIWSRVIHGSRITLTIIVLVGAIVGPLGLVIGTVAGYLGGFVDTVLMRVTDIFMAFPRLVLALAFAAALGPGIENAVIAIAITTWPPYARVARAETIVLKDGDFISAIRLMGASKARILAGHIAPLCISSVVIRLTLDMAGIILIAAALGFLGLGAQPPAPEWGAMVATGRDNLVDQWWVATMPGIAIFIASLGFNLLGDGLRDVFDPKMR